MATTITVQRPAGRVIVSGGGGRVIVPARPSLRVAVGKQGPAGPAGPAGQTYDHSQAVAASVWTINHNLGFRPGVSVLTDGGVQRFVQVTHVSANQTRLDFNTATTGTAHFS